MDYSYGSDLDDVVTPIEGSPRSIQGELIESDSFCEMKRQNPPPQSRSGTRRARQELLETGLDSHDIRPDNLMEIFEELQAINKKLKKETQILQEREREVKERERMVSISQTNLQTIISHESRTREASLEKKFKLELKTLEQALKEKSKENDRLRSNFETMKMLGDSLKKEIETLKAEKEKVEKQASSAMARLVNLQRKQEFEQRQKESDLPGEFLPGKPSKAARDLEEKQTKPQKASSKLPTVPVHDIMACLLDWVCEAHLRQAITEQPIQPSERFSSPDFINGKIHRVLPALVDILKDFQVSNVKFSLPCLQFVYWSLMHLDSGQQNQQRTGMSSTLRRLGEEVFRVRPAKSAEAALTASPTRVDRPKDGLFFRSTNLHVRLLSSLIILKTLSQADHLAQAFDTLKVDLKTDMAKELFLYYQATSVVFTYLKPVNKVFLGAAVDLLLQMSTESPFMPPFLESCGTEACFRTLALILRTPISDVKVAERLAIILQKLSKIKQNRRLFEMYNMVGVIQELCQTLGKDNSFLALNLKSILFNLNAAAAN